MLNWSNHYSLDFNKSIRNIMPTLHVLRDIHCSQKIGYRVWLNFFYVIGLICIRLMSLRARLYNSRDAAQTLTTNPFFIWPTYYVQISVIMINLSLLQHSWASSFILQLVDDKKCSIQCLKLTKPYSFNYLASLILHT